jgi:hypothetical protein
MTHDRADLIGGRSGTNDKENIQEKEPATRKKGSSEAVNPDNVTDQAEDKQRGVSIMMSTGAREFNADSS